jgi:MoxR-like ATPase
VTSKDALRSGARAWVIRAGSAGENEDVALSENVALIGWSDLGELTPDMSREQLKDMISQASGEERSASLGQQAGEILRFIHDVEEGDLVVLPLLRSPGHVAVGLVAGPYTYRADGPFIGRDAHNHRPVTWLAKSVPYERFSPDLTEAFGRQGTIRQIGLDDAATRVLNAIRDEPRATHLLVKWAARFGPNTIDEHRSVAEAHGSAWFGVIGSATERPKLAGRWIDTLRSQIAAGIDTYVFISGPTCWRTRLLAVTASKDEVDANLIPSYYPIELDHGLWVQLADFEALERSWLTSHLELAASPGTPLTDGALRNQTSPMIVRLAAGGDQPRTHVWWVNQGTTYRASRDLGVLTAPQAGKDGRPRKYWTDLELAQTADIVLHYAGGTIKAVSRIREPAVIAPRPPEIPRSEAWKDPGYLVRTDYRELEEPVPLDAIQVEWRKAQGTPFDRDGGVRQGYFFGLSDTFVDQLAHRFPQLELDSSSPIGEPDVLDDAGGLSGTSLKALAVDRGLQLDDGVFGALAAALNSGKHVILTGPPGTAKTTLAQLAAQLARESRLSRGYVLTTATADWTTYETIGGLRPTTEQGLEFVEGHFLAAIRSEKWLVIDELNRSNFDRAFGQLFTVLSGQPVVLPYSRPGQSGPLAVVPPGAQPPSEGLDVLRVPATWRVVATMNVFDKSLLFEMSYALMRRFAFIEVPSPADEVFRSLIDRYADGDATAADTAKRLLALRTIKDIGPAVYIDIAKYAHARRIDDPPDDAELAFECFYSFLLPQFEGIGDDQAAQLFKMLVTATEPTMRGRLRSTLTSVLGVELGGDPPATSTEQHGDEDPETLPPE